MEGENNFALSDAYQDSGARVLKPQFQRRLFACLSAGTMKPAYMRYRAQYGAPAGSAMKGPPVYEGIRRFGS